ncbi:death domain-containing protein CRADD-like [Centruroides vittatus]|uniref:death domain-containing protein CRADD-like n=1 Tax=Centruroides vittatus TaxID=120091 RepID=UPI00350F46D1
MDQCDQLRLKKLHSKLMKDVRVSYILPYLSEVLTDDDEDLIKNEKTERGKINMLLNILPRRGPQAFSCFCEGLAENYDWLYKELISLNIEEEVNNDIRIDKRIQEINNEMVDVLRENNHLVRNWRTLAHRLGMSSCCSTIQIQANIYLWDLKECFLNLMEKWHAQEGHKATVGNLIDALRQEKFNDAADLLEEKFIT